MEISVEISKYPLTADYAARVDDFLYRLHAYPDIRVETNTLSTQVFGPASTIFPILEKEICRSFEKGQSPFVLKILKGNLAGNEIKDYR